MRGQMQQSHTIIANRLLETQSSINRQLHQVARTESANFTQQTNTLNEIRMLAENMPDNHTTAMNKLDELKSILALLPVRQGYLRSNTTLQASTPDVLRRILRAELKRVMIPVVEGYLDSYKSSHDVQLEGIRRSLDRIILDLGHYSQDEAVPDDSKGLEEPTTSADDFDFDIQDDNSISRESTTKDTELIGCGVDSGISTNSGVVGSWSRSWSCSWIFRWRIGVLKVRVSTSHSKPGFRQRTYPAYKTFKSSSTRYTHHVSIDFQPALSLLVTRGISITCETRQDQRGYYQMCPMISTFAIVPYEAKVFSLVRDRDIKGLQGLFEAGSAAPTDRDDRSWSLLHVSTFRL